MAQFLLVYRRPHDLPALSPEQMQQNIPKWQAWFEELSAKNHLKDRGAALEHEGKFMRGPKKNVTDGPYAEKDLVMGFTLIDARDLDQATALAAGCPALAGDMVVEVRPVIQMRQ
jgi:hypothetical protein